jgi:hypothetical protein
VKRSSDYGRERSAERRSWFPELTALAVYAVLWVVLIGREAVLDPAHTCACIGRGDPGLFMWALKWWPHAIGNGIDPFWTSSIWFPSQTDIPATTSVPAFSLVLWPVTELAGVVVTYNVATALSGILSAWFAYRLCRYVTGAWLPSLVGGYVFGFSSYELGQTIGHLHLIPIFMVPAAVHLVLLRLDGRIGVRRFVILLAAVFALQVLISTEVLFAGLMFGFTALALAFWLVPARRGAIQAMVLQLFAAGALAMLVLSPFLYEAFRGLGLQPSLDWPATARVFSADPLNYLIPTEITWIGGDWASSLSAKFNSSSGGLAGNVSESGAYIGLPLLALAGWFVVRTWKRPATRFVVVLTGLIVVASLGAQLHVAEAPTGPLHQFDQRLWLPWAAVAYLPVFDHLLPVRFAMFAFLVVAVLVAQALALPARRGWVPWVVAGAGVLTLLPTFSSSYWNGKATATPFFDDGTYKRYIGRDEIVLVFPMQSGDAMVWQANSDWYFRMASGYISAEVPPEVWDDPVGLSLLSPTGVGPIAPENLPAAVRDFLDRHQVAAVIVDLTAAPFWEGVLDQIQLRKDVIGGVVVYRVARSVPYAAWGSEFSAASITPGHAVRWMVRPEASVPIVNPLPSPRVVTLSGVLRGAPSSPDVHAKLEYPDGTAQDLAVRPTGTALRRRLTLQPGESTLGIVAQGPKYFARPDPRAHYLELMDVRLSP